MVREHRLTSTRRLAVSTGVSRHVPSTSVGAGPAAGPALPLQAVVAKASARALASRCGFIARTPWSVSERQYRAGRGLAHPWLARRGRRVVKAAFAAEPRTGCG